MQGTAFAMQSTEQDRAVAKLHAQAAQWEEYDDEYDDSFDDLGTDFGADAGAGEYDRGSRRRKGGRGVRKDKPGFSCKIGSQA